MWLVGSCAVRDPIGREISTDREGTKAAAHTFLWLICFCFELDVVLIKSFVLLWLWSPILHSRTSSENPRKISHVINRPRIQM